MAESPGVHPVEAALKASMKMHQVARVKGRMAEQIASRASFRESVEEAFNPFAADKRATQFRTLGERANEMVAQQRKEAKGKVVTAEEAGQMAQQRQEAHPELDAEQLLQLRGFFLREKVDAEAALNHILGIYGDPTLADEALDFLIETTTGDVHETMVAAKGLLDTRLGREVRAGYNVDGEVQEYTGKGLGSQTELRDLYRDVTGNPRELGALFSELSNQYPFDQLRDVVEFLLGSLGSDLKAKGPSIARGELYRLVTDVRALQSILGVYLFFRGRVDLVKSRLDGHELDFEAMAQEFMALVEERYPTAMKVLRSADRFDLTEITDQIVLFEQFRDAIRQVAPRIYRSLQHRYDLLMAIIECLEELEDQIEEEEE